MNDNGPVDLHLLSLSYRPHLLLPHLSRVGVPERCQRGVNVGVAFPEGRHMMVGAVGGGVVNGKVVSRKVCQQGKVLGTCRKKIIIPTG